MTALSVTNTDADGLGAGLERGKANHDGGDEGKGETDFQRADHDLLASVKSNSHGSSWGHFASHASPLRLTGAFTTARLAPLASPCGDAYLDSMNAADADPARDPDRLAALSRRAEATARARAETGVDEAMIDALVEGFYARVRDDALIGPIFAARIDDWAPHLAQMKRFWSSVLLLTGVYEGRPMPKHLPLPIDARHFDRWLDLFRQTARDLCPPTAADHFITRAERIAMSLELGIASSQGVLLMKDERYVRPAQSWSPDDL